VLNSLREHVFEANLELVRRGTVVYTFGNVSGMDRDSGMIAIKPSGVPYDQMSPQDMVIVDIQGNVVEGSYKPSSDVATHLLLYRSFAGIGGVAHTHSRAATAWAQARKPIPCFGTTHADYFYGSIPVTDPLTDEEIAAAYEHNTGVAIVRRLQGSDPLHMPAILVAGHGPFAWGTSAGDAAHNAVLLEEVAAVALQTVSINSDAQPIGQALLDRHFFRKHGAGAYYGQGDKRG
jgi:L-ribulose-5-phosphate 4-epimerase